MENKVIINKADNVGVCLTASGDIPAGHKYALSDIKKGETVTYHLKTGLLDKEQSEKMQAKIQQYREIPEDPGGLLKAFIYQEYRQNRYNEQ